MNDPFLNLYNIIIDTCQNNKFNINFELFKTLGDNNPENFVEGGKNVVDIDGEIERLIKRKIIFHDQEPIMFNSFQNQWDLKIARINRLQTNHLLSNSEKNSFEKNQLLAKSGWQDFYWFSNGFLSLEWYRFYRYANYLEKNWQPKNKFSSYNRILNNREHRLIIAGYLLKNFLNQSILSCHKKYEDHLIFNKNLPLNQAELIDYALNQENIFLGTHNTTDTNLSYHIDVKDFIDSFCHVVTERIFYEDRIHLTEKIFRPIVCCRPFILVSSPYSLRYLKEYGFKTFDSFWNEKYDSILDHNSRMNEILKVIHYLGSLSQNEMINMLNQMKSILIYNRNHFYDSFQKHINVELFSNLNFTLSQPKKETAIFESIMNNLTSAEIKLIENSNIDIDLFDTSEDYFQIHIMTSTLNNSFNKNNVEEETVRPLIERYLKHFKYYYQCVNRSFKQ